MSSYGIIITGTSVSPLVISIENLIESNVKNIYLLATEDTDKYKGTESIADSIIFQFNTLYPKIKFSKIIIDRSSIDKIKESLNKYVKSTFENDNECELFVDYTGGTKVQSAFIRYYFNSLKTAECEVNEIYINGFTKEINKNKKKGKHFEKLKNADNNKIIHILCNIKGYTFYPKENMFVDNTTNMKYEFENIYIEDFIINFEKKLKNEMSFDKNKNNKNKVKLEMFQIVNDAEKIGEEFCKITILTPKGKSKLYENTLLKEMLGIKRYEYKYRLEFEDE